VVQAREKLHCYGPVFIQQSAVIIDQYDEMEMEKKKIE